MKRIVHTTPQGSYVVIHKACRTGDAPGQFFAMLEEREPLQENLPDRYVIERASGTPGGPHHDDYANLTTAIETADLLEATAARMFEVAQRIGSNKSGDLS